MRKNILIVSTTVMCLLGCGGGSSAWSKVDSWYSPPEMATSQENAHPVAWAEVMHSAAEEAGQRLESKSCVEVPASEVARFIERSPSADQSLKLYLVRGLYLNRGTGGFSVSSNGSDLYVHHGSLGRSAVPMNRQPLVVALPSEPSKVYVSVAMAE